MDAIDSQPIAEDMEEGAPCRIFVHLGGDRRILGFYTSGTDYGAELPPVEELHAISAQLHGELLHGGATHLEALAPPRWSRQPA